MPAYKSPAPAAMNAAVSAAPSPARSPPRPPCKGMSQWSACWCTVPTRARRPPSPRQGRRLRPSREQRRVSRVSRDISSPSHHNFTPKRRATRTLAATSKRASTYARGESPPTSQTIGEHPSPPSVSAPSVGNDAFHKPRAHGLTQAAGNTPKRTNAEPLAGIDTICCPDRSTLPLKRRPTRPAHSGMSQRLVSVTANVTYG